MAIDLSDGNPDWLGGDEETSTYFSEMNSWEELYRKALSTEPKGAILPYNNVLELGYRTASNLESMLEEDASGAGNGNLE